MNPAQSDPVIDEILADHAKTTQIRRRRSGGAQT